VDTLGHIAILDAALVSSATLQRLYLPLPAFDTRLHGLILRTII